MDHNRLATVTFQPASPLGSLKQIEALAQKYFKEAS